MKFSQVIVTATVFSLFGLFTYTASARDCPGVRYEGSGTCKSAGLDTHNGTCKNNRFFPSETLCDDDRGGYIICSGPRKCTDVEVEGCNWDFNKGKPCRKGYFNYDCSGGCGKIK